MNALLQLLRLPRARVTFDGQTWYGYDCRRCPGIQPSLPDRESAQKAADGHVCIRYIGRHRGAR